MAFAIALGGDGEIDPDQAAVLSYISLFEAEVRYRAADEVLQRRTARRTISGRRDLLKCQPDKFFRRVPDNLGKSAVASHDPTLKRGMENSDRCLFEGCPVTLFAVAEQLFSLFLGSDVLDETFEVEQLSVLAADSPAIDRGPETGTIFAFEPALVPFNRPTLFEFREEDLSLIGIFPQIAAYISDRGQGMVDVLETQHPGERSIGSDQATVRSGTEDSFDCAVVGIQRLPGGFQTLRLRECLRGDVFGQDSHDRLVGDQPLQRNLHAAAIEQQNFDLERAACERRLAKSRQSPSIFGKRHSSGANLNRGTREKAVMDGILKRRIEGQKPVIQACGLDEQRRIDNDGVFAGQMEHLSHSALPLAIPAHTRQNPAAPSFRFWRKNGNPGTNPV